MLIARVRFMTSTRLMRNALLCALVAHASIASAELSVGVSIGAGHSDNIRRVDLGETSETIGVAGLDILWREQTRRLDADFDADLSYFDYLDDTFDSEVVGTANGFVRLGILPERLTWLFQDSFGQVHTDPFEPSTPETRENLNYFTTGPDLTLRFGSETFLRIFGRYSHTNYEESPLDGERTSAGLAFGRDLSAGAELALNFVSEDVDFDDELTEDFKRQHAYLSYGIEGSRTDLTTELGYTWLERDTGRDADGALVNVNVSREVSPSSRVTLEVGTRFTDASDSLRSTAEQIGGGPDVTSTADPFENRSVMVAWRFFRNRTGMTLGAGWSEDRYEEEILLDRTRWVYDINLSRLLSPTLETSIGATLSDEKFDRANFSADELTVAARLSWRFSRTLGLELTVDHLNRDTSSGLGEFEENRAFLLLRYRPYGEATVARR